MGSASNVSNLNIIWLQKGLISLLPKNLSLMENLSRLCNSGNTCYCSTYQNLHLRTEPFVVVSDEKLWSLTVPKWELFPRTLLKNRLLARCSTLAKDRTIWKADIEWSLFFQDSKEGGTFLNETTDVIHKIWATWG